jgi:hypothetical protein
MEDFRTMELRFPRWMYISLAVLVGAMFVGSVVGAAGALTGKTLKLVVAPGLLASLVAVLLGAWHRWIRRMWFLRSAPERRGVAPVVTDEVASGLPLMPSLAPPASRRVIAPFGGRRDDGAASTERAPGAASSLPPTVHELLNVGSSAPQANEVAPKFVARGDVHATLKVFSRPAAPLIRDKEDVPNATNPGETRDSSTFAPPRAAEAAVPTSLAEHGFSPFADEEDREEDSVSPAPMLPPAATRPEDDDFDDFDDLDDNSGSPFSVGTRSAAHPPPRSISEEGTPASVSRAAETQVHASALFDDASPPATSDPPSARALSDAPARQRWASEAGDLDQRKDDGTNCPTQLFFKGRLVHVTEIFCTFV